MESRQLKVCMLLPFRYEHDMVLYPGVQIPSYITNFGHQVSWVLSGNQNSESDSLCLGDIVVHRVSGKRWFPGNTVLSNSLNHVLDVFRKWRLLRRLFQRGRYNIVFVRDNIDIFDGLMAVHIKRRYEVPFVLQLSNPLEQFEVRYQLHPKRPHIVYRIIGKLHTALNLRLLRQADLALPVSKWLHDDLVNDKKLPKERLLPLPPGVDADAFSRRDGARVRQRYCLEDERVVVYVGTMDRGRDLGILIHAIAEVRRAGRRVKLMMVGDGDGVGALGELVHELDIEDEVMFVGRVPQSEVHELIAACDIGVSPVPPDPWFKLSSPIKMLEYMASAKPVVANVEIPEHEEVLNESGGGILVRYDAAAFAGAIIQLLDHPEKANRMGRSGREWVVANRSYEVLARGLERRYLELLA